MQIAARTASWAKAGGWVNPYVTDGLVAMWDGEWNAGDGIRNAFLPVIKDITGSGRDLIFGNIEYDFGDKFIHFILPQGSGIKVITPEFENYVTGTLEVVYRKKDCQKQDLEIGVNSIRHDINSGKNFIWGVDGRSGSAATLDLASFSCSVEEDVIVENMFENGVEKINKSQRLNRHVGVSGFRATWNPNELWFYTMRFYNRILNRFEIAANYAIDKARFNLP